jgi:hypothetical protein
MQAFKVVDAWSGTTPALEFLASPRGTQILRDIAAGTHEGNIARNK